VEKWNIIPHNRVQFQGESTLRILLLAEQMEGDQASFRIRLRHAERLAERGHRVTFAHPVQGRSLVGSRSAGVPGLTIVRTPGLAPARFRRGGFGLLDLLVKLRLVLGRRFDLVHTTAGHRPGQLLPALAARLFRGSVVVDEWWEWYGRGGRLETRRGPAEKLIGLYDRLTELPVKRCYSAVIAIASPLKHRVRDNGHITVLNGGAETDLLRPREQGAARQRLELDQDLFIVGLVGAGEADHPDNIPFLEAVKRCAVRHRRLRVFVTGQRSYIERRCLESDTGDRYLYRGWLAFDEYNDYLNACDLFALPLADIPRNAGRWPHKIGDFLALGKPVVTNPVGDLARLFRQHRLGLLCEHRAEGFEDALEQLLRGEADPEALCADSRRLANEDLSAERRTDETEALYRRLVEKRTG